MKTLNQQFSELVNGNTGTVFNGVVGTNLEERENFWEQFRAHYTKEVSVNINGVDLTLAANHSLSGKSTSYFTPLTNEQYIAIRGFESGLSKKGAYLMIDNGRVTIYGGGNFSEKIDNSKVTIL